MIVKFSLKIRTLKDEEVDVSRLIRVFVNNYESHKRCKMIEILKHIDDLKEIKS